MRGIFNRAVSAVVLLPWLLLPAIAQSERTASAVTAQTAGIPSAQERHSSIDSQAEDQLQQGTALTSKGNFSEAIPHLLAARGRVSNEYAAGFNLALCYVGIRQYQQAIQILNDLRNEGHNLADVENLLAQAYIGNGQSKEAFAALENAATITPQNEKLYLFVANACAESQNLVLGVQIVDVGLKHLPQSARLFYQRAVFLSQLDQFDRAKADFDLAGKLGQGTDIGYIARAHEALLDGDIADAVNMARSGIGKGFANPILLTILGQALIRSGVAPGDSGFAEAQAALEEAVTERPNDPSAQIALGQIYLASARLDEAIAHLEKGRQLQPDQTIVYANLAKAYERHGDSGRAQQALAMLEKLNEDQAERIRSAPGDRKMSYGGGVVCGEKPSQR